MSSDRRNTQAEDVAAKIVRYRKDFRAFASEQLRLGGKPLEFWACQLPLLESVERQMATQGFVRSVWLKARQIGSSTLAQALVAWRTMLWPNVSAIVIGDEAERSRTLFEISRSFYDHMDEDIRPVGRYITKRELVFANPSHVTRMADPGLRSRIFVESAHKKNLAIGSAWVIAHLSEVSRFRDPNFVLDGVIPAVHRVPGTMIIMESTAEMSGTWFRNFCEASMRGDNAFEFSFGQWWLHPEYSICPICRKSYPKACRDEAHAKKGQETVRPDADERHLMVEFGLTPNHIVWMREKLAEMGNDWDLFRQSYPMTPEDAWVSRSVQVFPLNKLREQRHNVRPPIRMAEVYPGPRVLDAPNGRLKIWEEPKPGKAYDAGIDVAMGSAETEDESLIEEHRDYSVACILERGTNAQVAEWVSKAVDPFELATVLYWLGTYYNQAQMAVETNSIGGGTNQQLSKLGYPSCYQWRYRDEISPRYSRKTGWETSHKSKPWLVGFAAHELMNGRVIIRSEQLLKEMENFVMKGYHEWGAVAGHKDDKVMAWMIALLTSDDENFERYFGLRKDTSADGSGPGAKPKPEAWEADLDFRRPKPELETAPWE